MHLHAVQVAQVAMPIVSDQIADLSVVSIDMATFRGKAENEVVFEKDFPIALMRAPHGKGIGNLIGSTSTRMSSITGGRNREALLTTISSCSRTPVDVVEISITYKAA